MFRHACVMGLEGLVSKRAGSHTSRADARVGSKVKIRENERR